MIELNNVSKWYGQFQVLTDCTTEVAKGDVMVICGPSGSGKSTLIKTVNGLEPIQQGQIIVDGITVNDPKTNLSKLRARIGMVFQNFELFPHLSIRENLTIGQIKVLGRSADESHCQGLKYLDAWACCRSRTNSPPAVGRPAAARGDRPRAVDGPDRHAVLRADIGARSGK